MKIYTKKGDQGTTQVYLHQPVQLDKNHALLTLYGTLDEFNAQLGVLHQQVASVATVNHQFPSLVDALDRIQSDVFQVGFAFSAAQSFPALAVTRLEQEIDSMQEQLPTQRHFILPGGTLLAAQSHVCRALCRRAERCLVDVMNQLTTIAEAPLADSITNSSNQVILPYLNRLSDWLFVVARLFNHLQQTADRPVNTSSSAAK